ncbi:MAG: type II toxin-antitoxin system RelE/ParE family toxin [Caulobacteraceae bacterium]
MEVRQTGVFRGWLADLRDRRARDRILARIDRLGHGNSGAARAVGGGVSELRIDHGPGYRVYFTRIGTLVVVLLCGGDKATQGRDIETARSMAAELRQCR